MAQINKPTDYFNGLPYTGNDTATSYNNGLDMNTNGGLVWLKTRNAVGDHGLFDSVRGVNKRIRSNTTDAEDTLASNGVTSFDSTGFSLGTVAYNDTPYTFMSWSWLAGGTASSNTDGSITSQVSASTTSGFSIVSYTGTGATATVGHGLGAVPKMIIVKDRDASANWNTYHVEVGNAKTVQLNLTNAESATSSWNSTTPTSSVFSLGAVSAVNTSSNDYIAYCFAEKKGYSKFGSYTGNGSTDGTFVYTGFKPAFVMVKMSSGTSNWVIWDNKRDSYNVADALLLPNSSNAESGYSGEAIDLLSNGFKARYSAFPNNSGSTFVYMAFAAEPLVTTSNIPCPAR